MERLCSVVSNDCSDKKNTVKLFILIIVILKGNSFLKLAKVKLTLLNCRVNDRDQMQLAWKTGIHNEPFTGNVSHFFRALLKGRVMAQSWECRSDDTHSSCRIHLKI